MLRTNRLAYRATRKAVVEKLRDCIDDLCEFHEIVDEIDPQFSPAVFEIFHQMDHQATALAALCPERDLPDDLPSMEQLRQWTERQCPFCHPCQEHRKEKENVPEKS